MSSHGRPYGTSGLSRLVQSTLEYTATALTVLYYGTNIGLTCDLDLANGNGAAPQQAQQPHQGGQVQGENPHQTGKLINSTEIGNEGKMFVGGLSKQTTTDSLKAYFEG